MPYLKAFGLFLGLSVVLASLLGAVLATFLAWVFGPVITKEAFKVIGLAWFLITMTTFVLCMGGFLFMQKMLEVDTKKTKTFERWRKSSC